MTCHIKILRARTSYNIVLFLEKLLFLVLYRAVSVLMNVRSYGCFRHERKASNMACKSINAWVSI